MYIVEIYIDSTLVSYFVILHSVFLELIDITYHLVPPPELFDDHGMLCLNIYCVGQTFFPFVILKLVIPRCILSKYILIQLLCLIL
jgi:hypothetical protein